MAHGAPDWWNRSYIDVVTQTLAELIVRPKYGTASYASYVNATYPASTKTKIITVEGTGIIYGGSLDIGGTASQATDIFKMFVDDNEFDAGRFSTYEEWYRIQPAQGCFMLTTYDNVNFFYGLAIVPGITFEEKIELEYEEIAGNGCEVYAEIRYALI